VTYAWGGEIAAEALLREGVTCMFGLTAGHMQAIQDFAYRRGIDVFQVRHEQAGAFAADAYARVSRRPGVCFATAGPGMLNMATGLHMAYLAGSPVVALLGGHKVKESDRHTLQEADAASVLGSITKWTRRCHSPDQIGFYIRKAFRDAMTPPYGPVAIEFPLDATNWEPVDRAGQVAYVEGEWRHSGAPAVPPDPNLLRCAVDALSASRRPLLIAGDGVHWDDSGDLLRQVAERYGMPVNLRRLARGAVNEHSPRVLPSAIRKPFIEDADLIVLLGLDVGYFESFGAWRTNARFIQVNRAPEQIALNLPTAVELQADTRSFLTALLNSDAGSPRNTTTWLDRVAEQRAVLAERRAEAAASHDAERPVHPGTIARQLCALMPPGIPVVLDSFTASAFLSAEVELTASGQLLDSGLSAAIGHGVGMGIGASVATGSGPVLVMMGDGGMGIGGGDVETAVRLGLPVLYVIYNNSTFCAGMEKYCYGKDFRALGPTARGGWNLTPDIRYDKMYAPLGCHTENVDQPEQLSGAIDRALGSGKTSVINIMGSRDVVHPLYDTAYAKEMFWHLPPAEIEEPARRRHIDHHYPMFHGGSSVVEEHDGGRRPAAGDL
jgi:acetolactate synthase-1/2/3 large subunit